MSLTSTVTSSSQESLEGIQTLLSVVAQLRNPEGGCPWDLKQTHETLRPFMLEEAYEAVEAMGSGDRHHIKEELGDVLLQVVLNSQIAADENAFTFDEVCTHIAEKLIRRHPHVFNAEGIPLTQLPNRTVVDANQVTENWQAIKAAEKGEASQLESILKDVSQGQPALSRALDTSKRAVKVGFRWPNLDSLKDCVASEFKEFYADVEQGSSFEKLEDEMGDIFFASVNLAREFDIDPEVALTRATAKFTKRFKAMETLILENFPDVPLKNAMAQLDFKAWDDLWNEAKAICSSH